MKVNKNDPDFADFMRDRQSPVPLEYSFVDPDFESITNQIKLFDKDYNTPFDETISKLLMQAEDLIVDYYDRKGVRSDLIDIDEIDFNLESSPGHGYKKLYRNKREFFKYNKKEVVAYLNEFEGTNPLWTVSKKSEYLKNSKIEAKNCRIFEIPPITFLTLQHSVIQSFNKSLYSVNDSPIKVGCVFQRGGFDSLMRPLMMEYIGMGDATKWDKSFFNQLRRHCYNIRVRLYKGPEAKRAEFMRRIKFVYEKLRKTAMVTPWGQVIEMLGAMLSGCATTTTDNSLGHLLIVLSMVLDRYSVKTLEEAMRIIEYYIYSDDHMFQTNDAYFSSYPVRARFYARFYVTLKEEDDLVLKRTPVGLTFLGAKIILHGKYYAPQYNAKRIMSALAIAKGTLTPPQKVSKIRALLVLSTFTGMEIFTLIREYLKYYITTYSTTCSLSSNSRKLERELLGTDMPFIPDYEWCVSFWLGTETGSVSPLPESNKSLVWQDLQNLWTSNLA